MYSCERHCHLMRCPVVQAGPDVCGSFLTTNPHQPPLPQLPQLPAGHVDTLLMKFYGKLQILILSDEMSKKVWNFHTMTSPQREIYKKCKYVINTLFFLFGQFHDLRFFDTLLLSIVIFLLLCTSVGFSGLMT